MARTPRTVTISARLSPAEAEALAALPGGSMSEKIRNLARRETVVDLMVTEQRRALEQATEKLAALIGKTADQQLAALAHIAHKSAAPEPKTETKAGPGQAPDVGPSAAEKLLRSFAHDLVTSLFAAQPPEQRRDEIIAGARAVQRGEISQKSLALVLLWLSGYQPTINTANGFRTAAERLEKGC